MKSVSPTETQRDAGGLPSHSTGRSVERVCAVLSAFSAAPQLSLAELTARTGLPKPTVHRLANSLVSTGFLRHTEDGGFALGIAMGELVSVVRRQVDVAEVCTPALDALAERTGETVLLATADWDTLEMTLIGTRVSQQTLSVLPVVKRTWPISAGALGKALLLGLTADDAEDVLARAVLPALTDQSPLDHDQLLLDLATQRPTGFAVSKEEFANGVSGVGVPVLPDNGRPRGAIAISGPTFRIGEQLAPLGQILLDVTTGLRPRDAITAPSPAQPVRP